METFLPIARMTPGSNTITKEFEMKSLSIVFVFFAMAMALALAPSLASAQTCDYRSRPRILRIAKGTELRRWVSETNLQWVPAEVPLNIFPNAPVIVMQSVHVQQIHTESQQAEQVKHPAETRCEMIGRTPRGCNPASDGADGYVKCTGEIWEWRIYDQVNEVIDLPPRRNVISSRDYSLSLQLTGSKLQSFEK